MTKTKAKNKKKKRNPFADAAESTSDEERAKSLDVPVKSIRVQNYQSQTVLSCCELTGA